MLYKILTPSDYESLPRGEEEEWLGASIDVSQSVTQSFVGCSLTLPAPTLSLTNC